MRQSFFCASRPLLFAHRGGAALAPENSIAAFDRAVALGADGLELDVRLSSDGVVVVHHDATLERTTPLSGPIAEQPFARLESVDVPSLSAVLSRYPESRVIVEMKVNHPAFAERVIAAVLAAGALERVCLGAFGRRVLQAARRLHPAIATSAAREEVRWALYRSWCRWPVSRAAYGGYQVPELSGVTRIVSRRFVAEAHRAGLGVQVWTVDREEDAARLLDWGVDAIISDRPDIMVPLVAQWSPGLRRRA